jgi:lipopolysaccharide transport system ATP-binding protein
MNQQAPDVQHLKKDDDVVVSVRGVGKMYPLYAQPRDRLKQSIKEMLPGFLAKKTRQFHRQHWALNDISFDLKRGETLGIIGKNGSGKSTLLQIISGTLAPTNGQVWVKGRVAALLELGSGFNSEFTGRENVYMNGSILGLSTEEIDQRFEEIANFADIGEYLDHPVKHYSSGMYVRLAFAVQTFVPKEIFVVDEALAVGDEAFKRKCLASLDRFRQAGGTVLLVSHDLQTVIYQCDRTILLHEGTLVTDGKPKSVTDLYQRLLFSNPHEARTLAADVREYGLEAGLKKASVEFEKDAPVTDKGTDIIQESTDEGDSGWFDPNLPELEEIVYGTGDAEIIDFGMYDEKGQRVNMLLMGKSYRWTYLVRFKRNVTDVQFGMLMKRVDGLPVSSIASKQQKVQIDRVAPETIIEASFDLKINLVPGTYYLNSGVDGFIDGRHTYLQRRVDISMVRVVPNNEHQFTGIAYLEQSFSYNVIQESIPEK